MRWEHNKLVGLPSKTTCSAQHKLEKETNIIVCFEYWIIQPPKNYKFFAAIMLSHIRLGGLHTQSHSK